MKRIVDFFMVGNPPLWSGRANHPMLGCQDARDLAARSLLRAPPRNRTEEVKTCKFEALSAVMIKM